MLSRRFWPSHERGYVGYAEGAVKILALDVGATTGWAYGCPGAPTLYGVEVFEGTRTERLGSFLAWLTLQLGMETYRNLGLVVCRRPAASDMTGVVEAMCQEYGVGTVAADAQIVKSFVAKGHTATGAVIAAIRRRGYKPECQHDANALAVLTYARATIEREAA